MCLVVPLLCKSCFALPTVSSACGGVGAASGLVGDWSKGWQVEVRGWAAGLVFGDVWRCACAWD